MHFSKGSFLRVFSFFVPVTVALRELNVLSLFWEFFESFGGVCSKLTPLNYIILNNRPVIDSSSFVPFRPLIKIEFD